MISGSARQLRPGENDRGRVRMPHRIKIPDPCQKFVQSCLRENVHRDDDFWFDLPQDLDHVVLVQGPHAIDRHHHDIDRAEIGEMGLCQGMVQMAEMGDAQIGDVEDKNRVAVVPGAAELPNIRRHIVDPYVAVLEAMARNSAARIPSAQDVFHSRLDRIAVVSRMGIIHCDDVGRDRRSYRIVVIRNDPNTARALDQKTRMAEKGDRYRFFCAGSREAQRPPGNHPGARRLRRRRDHEDE